jgi:DNA (cytosine-5)-methyltransferase 1
MIFAADLFCGAGGTSTGMVLAANKRGIVLDLVAVNHWQRAVDTHSRNHPWARHVCANLGSVEADPSKLVPGGRLDLLVASPECTHHSNARGGKPCSDQSRASAWHVLHWMERLRVEELLLENVKEFETWGPLNKNGRPNTRLKGSTFQSFVSALRGMGYQVDWRVMNAADYGEATTRKRLFLRASRKKIVWPAATHMQYPSADLSGLRKRWRPARDVIDWDLKGENIATRKRPLQPRTLQRIEAGLRKFGGEAFLVVLRGTQQRQAGSWSKSVDGPVPTISAGGIHAGLCEPFVMNVSHQGADDSRCRSVDAPLSAIPAGHRGEHALVQPFLVEYHSEKGNGKARVASVDAPLPTATTENRFGLCEPFLVPMEHSGRNSLRSVDEPMPTITTAKGGAFGVCEPFLTKYYGAGNGATSVQEPMGTVTTKDRFALVDPQRHAHGMEIRFRMLQPHELAAAMGFDGYQFAGNKTEQVKQIGNAVCVHMAEALCGTILDRATRTNPVDQNSHAPAGADSFAAIPDGGRVSLTGE